MNRTSPVRSLPRPPRPGALPGALPGEPPGEPPAPSRTSRAALLCIVSGALCLLGLMMVLSASSVEALHVYGGAWLFFERQVVWLILGVAVMAATIRLDYHQWRPLARPLVIGCLFLLVIVLIPGLGLSVSGSRRWLGWGPIRIQPSELAKVALLLFSADLLARRADRVHERGAIVRPLLVVSGALGALIMLEPDMGTTIVLALIALTVLFVGGLPVLRMAGVLIGSAAVGLVVGMLEGYRRARLFSFLDPWKDAGNTGYQVAQSLVALGSGHVTGVGLGASRAKWGFLPNSHTDFIFAIIGEELGLLGTLLVVGLFIAFAYLGVKTALRAPDRFGTLLAAGVTGWVAGQALVNMGAVTGRLPVTGVPLPFVSFGGSSLVVTLAAVGMLVNVASQGADRNEPRVPEKFAVITGGGTGGHVVPALAIGRALVERGHAPESLHFVGSRRGIETRLVPEAGFPLTVLSGRGIQRRLTAENIPAAAGLAWAVAQAARLLHRERPRVVVSVGGYASVPYALAAVALRIPLVIHEQNAAPGAANRMLAPFARACAVSYPGTPLPRPRLTGNPVRPEVLTVDRAADMAEARRDLGLPVDRRVLAIFGGSLGSLRIDRAVVDALPAWLSRADLAVHHVVGERDWDLLSSSLPPLPGTDGLHYQSVRYEDRMPRLYAAADLFVCRAGGNTVAELAAVGAPSILVPLPGAPADHQTANARVLADAGAAVLVRDEELEGARLVAEVGQLVRDPEHLASMAKAAASLGRKDAADLVAALAEECARG